MNTKAPIVSIIIPCYNCEDHVAEAIESSLEQTYTNCEVVVIDDGSKDGSTDIIAGYSRRIRWTRTSNRGGSAARNLGLRMASGKWIQFLDSDDALTPRCVEEKVSATCTGQVVVCSRVAVMHGYEKHQLTAFWSRSEYGLASMIRTGTPATPQPLHSKEALEAIGGFREDLACSQEYDLHLRLAIGLGIRFQVIDSIGVLIRPRTDSLSRKQGPNHDLAHALTFRYLLEKYYHIIASDAEIRNSLAQKATLTARRLWQKGMEGDALELVAMAKELSHRWPEGCYRYAFLEGIVRSFGFQTFEKAYSIVYRYAPRLIFERR